MHRIGDAPPRYYAAKNNVDRALKKYFGTPTDSPNLLFQIALKVSKIIYLGSMTKIQSNCDDSATRCKLDFSSVALNTEFINELNSKTQRARGDAQHKEAEKKTKPDY